MSDLSFTPLDPDHLHEGQVWVGEDGVEATVLVVGCSASRSQYPGCAIAKVLVGGGERYVGETFFVGRNLVRCVPVDWVEEVGDGGTPHMIAVPDCSKEWSVVGGWGCLRPRLE
jgi:hypothetical protein